MNDNKARLLLLAGAIEDKMKERGVSRMVFSELMKVPPSTVTKWLSGEHNFTIETLFKIEKVLQFSLFNLQAENSTADEWAWYITKNRTKGKVT